MSEAIATAAPAVKAPSMGTFERYLTLWVALCIVVGIALGRLVPGVFHLLGTAEVAQVNLPVAVLVWLMVIPMLLKIDLAALGTGRRALEGDRRHGRRQLAGEALLDGAAGLGVHRACVPAVSAGRSDRQLHGRADPAGGGSLHGHGVRVVEPRGRRAAFHARTGRARTTRSWWWPSRRSSACCSACPRSRVPWGTLLLSVVLYIVVPVIVAQLWRRSLLKSGGQAALDRTLKTLSPLSLGGAAADARAAVRLAGRTDHAAAGDHRHAGGADPDPGLFQCRACLLGEPPPRRRVVRGGPVRADRGLQLLRAGGGDGDRPVRLSVGRGARDGRRRADRGAGHAVGRAES